MKSIAFAMAALMAYGPLVLAQTDEGDEAKIATTSAAKRRSYAGGRDEQELTVQTTLPQTTRMPEAPKAPVAPVPESDSDSHD